MSPGAKEVVTADSQNGGNVIGGVEGPLVLVTGGAGYIGSHCCVELLQAGFRVIILDNLSNSSSEAIERIEEISGRSVNFFKVDLRDEVGVNAVFNAYQHGSIYAVIHFAGLKAVGESSQIPLDYYDNNVSGSLVLFKAMNRHQVHRLVYSSSATVYGEPAIYPINEECPVGPTSPYGHTKLMVEEIITDLAKSYNWQAVILRYFNPVGAHPSGRLGEHPRGTPNNLMPYLAQVAAGKLSHITVFGTDYFTRDGTGVRDYIHVIDLCKGHLAALKAGMPPLGCTQIYNLGTGIGHTVLEMIDTFTKTTATDVPFTLGPRRPGDVATLLADPSKANKLLSWSALLSVETMCQDLWRWQSNNIFDIDQVIQDGKDATKNHKGHFTGNPP